MSSSLPHFDCRPGTARLGIIIPVATLSFFYMNVLEYSLPFYLGVTPGLVRLGTPGGGVLRLWDTMLDNEFYLYIKSMVMLPGRLD